MDTGIATYQSPAALRFATQVYARLVLAGFALIPAFLIAYLYFFQNPRLTFEDHIFHEIAIAVATLEGAFITFVTWRCYQSSGEPLLRWLTLGFLGFVLIYALHGLFTEFAHDHIWLFLLYGPASRLTMAGLLFVGLLSYNQPPDDVAARSDPRMWLMWIALFVAVDVAVAAIALSPIAGHPAVRGTMEAGALAFSALNVSVMLLRRIRPPLMVIFGLAVTSFALSSAAFILAAPWNHMWWLAHIIFAAGFFLLSYGVIQAYLTTRSFSTIYSQEELMARLAAAMARAQSAMQELQSTNQKLEHLATTDPLTGAGNRRQFIARIEMEIERARRGGATFSLMALDLDHFKTINDLYGHQIGDEVLRKFAKKCLDTIRPYDYFARVGGEEFMILVPQTSLETASLLGDRIRTAISDSVFEAGIGPSIAVTISIGITEFGRDGDTLDAILRVADERLYRAKHEGRNRVIAA